MGEKDQIGKGHVETVAGRQDQRGRKCSDSRTEEEDPPDGTHSGRITQRAREEDPYDGKKYLQKGVYSGEILEEADLAPTS